jgi:hypothetical protein
MVNSDNGAIIPEIVNSISRVYHWKGLEIYHVNQKKPGFSFLWTSAALLTLLSTSFMIIRRNKKKKAVQKMRDTGVPKFKTIVAIPSHSKYLSDGFPFLFCCRLPHSKTYHKPALLPVK